MGVIQIIFISQLERFFKLTKCDSFTNLQNHVYNLFEMRVDQLFLDIRKIQHTEIN